MGCTTSVILFEGLRTVIERNCGYICKNEPEQNSLEQAAQSLSRGDSRIWTHSALVNADMLCEVQCRYTTGMGCTTSAILFEGLRTVIERNCGYICKNEPEQNALEQAAQSPSRRDSRIWTHSALAKPKVIEPIDYENVLVQRKTQILSDSLRDMLQFPLEDFYVSITVSEQPFKACPVHSRHHALHLLKVTRPEKLPVHVFEVDEDVDKDEDTASLGSQKGGVTKHGWLYKGNMNSAISVTMRSFKRRYFHLTQLGDGSYNLNFYKDEKLSREPKGSIFLDSCMGVVQSNKVRRFAFELKMQDKSSYLLAADSELEMEEWITTLNKILQSNFEAAMQEKRNGDAHDDDELSKADSSSTSLDSFLPDMAKGARETEIKSKSESRLKLFTLDPDTQVEPFFVTLSLFDIQKSCKISADFHVDLNHPSVKQLIANASSQQTNGGGEVIMGSQRMPNGLPESMLQYSKQAAQKVLKNAKLACSRLGQYKMPFAWAARPLFKDAQGTLDKSARFSAIYRQDSNKLSNEDLLKLLADFRKPEKMSKLPVILGNLDVAIDNVAPDLTNCVTSSYIPVKQFENNGKTNILFEVEEFIPCIPKYSQPFTIYNNHLYVYPKHLKYDSQKSFAKWNTNPQLTSVPITHLTPMAGIYTPVLPPPTKVPPLIKMTFVMVTRPCVEICQAKAKNKLQCLQG
ncbi:UNVERIFIED_CONTAM: hypothetical protein FKN15_001028 [Acipenser sinensis]